MLYLDSNIVIYVVEQHAVFGPRALQRIAAAQAAGLGLQVSDLARMECLVGPLKAGDPALEQQYRTWFGTCGAVVVGITANVCDLAAQIRATFNFKPMDALHLAAAVVHGATIFLTADARLNSFTGLTVEVLS